MIMVQELILFVIGCITSVVLLCLALFAAYILYRRYIKGDYFINPAHVHIPCHHEIHCDDLKATAITLSQHEPQKKQIAQKIQRGRSKSVESPPLENILLREVVTLEIESESPLKIGQESMKSQKSIRSPAEQSSYVSSTDSNTDDDDEYDSTVSPLATPKSKSHHHRNDRCQMLIDEDMTQDVISSNIANSNSNSNSSPLRLCFDDMSHVMNIIDDDDVESEMKSANVEEKEEEEENVAITRMIVGESVRIVSDESRSSVSIDSTNFAFSPDDPQSLQMNTKNNKIEQEELEYKIQEEIVVTSGGNKDDAFMEKEVHIIRKPKKMRIGGQLDKLYENEETMNEEKDTTIETPQLQQTISDYQQNIRDMENSASRKERRSSVAALEMNRVVKAKRAVFETSNDLP